MKAEYLLTIALIIMFGFNLLHVKYHPYDLFYHDRLEMLSLISSEMTLFGGLLITFLSGEKEHCEVCSFVRSLLACLLACFFVCLFVPFQPFLLGCYFFF
jgi:hypothetical protein